LSSDDPVTLEVPSRFLRQLKGVLNRLAAASSLSAEDLADVNQLRRHLFRYLPNIKKALPKRSTDGASSIQVFKRGVMTGISGVGAALSEIDDRQNDERFELSLREAMSLRDHDFELIVDGSDPEYDDLLIVFDKGIEFGINKSLANIYSDYQYDERRHPFYENSMSLVPGSQDAG
jgi:hypothetical protein